MPRSSLDADSRDRLRGCRTDFARATRDIVRVMLDAGDATPAEIRDLLIRAARVALGDAPDRDVCHAQLAASGGGFNLLNLRAKRFRSILIVHRARPLDPVAAESLMAEVQRALDEALGSRPGRLDAPPRPGRTEGARAFHAIPADLGRALAFLDPVTKIERRFLIYVLERSLSLQDGRRDEPEPVPLDIPDLARRWGVPGMHASAQLEALVADRLLLVSGQRPTRYLVNVDVWDWVESGRIDPEDLDDIMGGFRDGGASSSDATPGGLEP